MLNADLVLNLYVYKGATISYEGSSEASRISAVWKLLIVFVLLEKPIFLLYH